MIVRFVTHVSSGDGSQYRVRLAAPETTTVKTVLGALGVGGDVVRCAVAFMIDSDEVRYESRPVPIIDDVVLKAQIDDAAAANQGRDPSEPPTIHVYFSNNISKRERSPPKKKQDDNRKSISKRERSPPKKKQDDNRRSISKRERSPPKKKQDDKYNINITTNEIDNNNNSNNERTNAMDTNNNNTNGIDNNNNNNTGNGSKSARGGARHGPARSNRNRRRSHVEAAAAIAAEAKLGRYRSREEREEWEGDSAMTLDTTTTTITANGTKEGRKGASKGRERINTTTTIYNDSKCYEGGGMELSYMVPSTTYGASKLRSGEATMYCALSGALAAEQAAFIKPQAKEALETLLTATAIVLAAVSANNNNNNSNNNPLGYLIAQNLPTPVPCSTITSSTKNIYNNNKLAKAMHNLKTSPILPDAENMHNTTASINAGPLWSRSKLRKDIALLAKVVDALFNNDTSRNNNKRS